LSDWISVRPITALSSVKAGLSVLIWSNDLSVEASALYEPTLSWNVSSFVCVWQKYF